MPSMNRVSKLTLTAAVAAILLGLWFIYLLFRPGYTIIVKPPVPVPGRSVPAGDYK